MVRYLIIIGPSGAGDNAVIERVSVEQRLACVFEDRSMRIWVSDPGYAILLPGHGAIIGVLFPRHGPARRLQALNENELDEINKSNGRELIDRYWGSYVAALSTGRQNIILRDPCAGLGCEYLHDDGRMFFASDVEILRNVIEKPIAINWDRVSSSLIHPNLPSEESALVGIRKLLPGTALQVDGSAIDIRQLWNPWNFALNSPQDNFEESAERIHRVVQSCISAWATCSPAILIGVSGGLDSSIITNCLHRSNANISCMTVSTEDRVGDEREYARVVAESAGLRLIEERYLLEDIDIDRSASERLSVPGRRAQEHAYNAAVARAGGATGARSFFTGNGGDSVFYMSQSARPIVDRFMSGAGIYDIWNTAGDVSRLTGANLPKVIKESVRIWRGRHEHYRWNQEGAFLAGGFIEDAKAPEHVWLTPPAGALPGKRAHVAMLLRVQDSLIGRDDAMGMPTINPLYSQPVIETCLAIPSWFSCAGGVNRSVVRKAFAGELDVILRNRRQKGGPDGFVTQIVKRYSIAIRARLHEGHLAKSGMIDLAAVDRAFNNTAGLSAEENSRLLSLFDTENWIGHWANRS
jgi:asparagine synthase (glutamine-hydrolysing)